MARVPVSVGDTLPQSGGPVFQRADVSAEAYGGAAARQLEQTGQRLQATGDRVLGIAVDMQEQANQKAVKDADVRFREGLIQLQYGDGTPENPGFFSLRGDSPDREIGSYLEKVGKLRSSISGTLANPRQQEDFGLAAGQIIVQAQSGMRRHAGDERQKSIIATSESRIKVATTEAALGFNDPEILARSLATARGEAVAQSQMMGVSPEVARDLIRAAETQVLSATIRSALDRDPVAAEALLKANSSRMEVGAALQISHLVNKKVLEVRSQEIADDVYGRVRSGQITMQQALDEIRKTYSGDEENAAVKELNERIAEQFRFEANLRARQSHERAEQGARDADARRARAEDRQKLRDEIADEDRAVRDLRRQAADARRDRRDEAEVTRLENQAQEREARNAARRQSLLRQEAADLLRATREEAREAATGFAQTVVDQGGTPEEQLAKVRENLTGEVRTLAERLLTEMQQRDARVATAARAERYNALSEQVMSGQITFDQIPVATRAEMSPSQSNALRELSRRQQLGIPNVSTPGYMGRLQELYSGRNIDGFLSVPMEEVRANLDDKDYSTFLGLWRQAAQGKLDPNVSDDARTVFGRINGYSQFQGPSKKDDRERLAEVILQEIRALRAEKRGQRITDAERNSIINDAVKEYISDRPGRVYGRNVSENAPAVEDARQRGPRLALDRAMQTIQALDAQTRGRVPAYAPLDPDPVKRNAQISEINTIQLTDDMRVQGREVWRRRYGTQQTPTEAQLKALYWSEVRRQMGAAGNPQVPVR